MIVTPQSCRTPDVLSGLPEISLVIPIFEEEESLPQLYTSIVEVLDVLDRPAEVILVDDGSRDGSFEIIRQIAAHDSRFRAIRLRRNTGQTAAMTAGFEHARGRVIIPLDADLQNDPRDIPLLLQKLDEGYDVVSGWRKDRQDAALTRLLPSRIANWIISRITGVSLHDYGCTLKAYRAEILSDVRLYGETHRLIPAYAAMEGARVTEIPVRHHARAFGKTKYGLSRTGKVILDLLVVRFLSGFSTRPMHLFGGAGLLLCSGGILSALVALVQLLFWQVKAHRNPLVLLAVFLFLLGVQTLLMGLLAELQIRTYHETARRPTYRVREWLNFERTDEAEPGG